MLTEAADGLLVLSETDAPLEYYFHQKSEEGTINEEIVAAWAGKPAGKEVETEDLDYFFRNMTNPHTDAGEEVQAQADRFRKLVETLKRHLSDITVYKIKEQSTKVLILGRTADGDYAGYETLVVET